MLPASKSSSPDRKALVGAPDLVMPRAQVARLLHSHVNERAAARAPGSVDDLPDAVFVRKPVEWLEQDRQERSRRRCLLAHCSFDLTHARAAPAGLFGARQ